MSGEVAGADTPMMSVDFTVSDMMILHALSSLGMGLMSGATDTEDGRSAMTGAMQALEKVGPELAVQAMEKLHAAVTVARKESARMDAEHNAAQEDA
jgi:hypothetical protein